MRIDYKEWQVKIWRQQILWERGGIVDGTYRGRDIYDEYTVSGKKNGSGGCIEGSALFELVSSQPEIVNEVTLLLQYFTKQRSVPAGCQLMLIHSPKCHPELTGEIIEYNWAAAKHWYPRQNLWRSEQKTSFENLSSNVSTKWKLIWGWSFLD
jgi:hypothetical protein